MSARPLREDRDKANHDRRDNRRCSRAAHSETAMVEWLVEKITQSRTERSGQDECRPEQSGSRRICPIIQSRNNSQPGDEYQGTALVSETTRVGDPVTERGSQRCEKVMAAQ